MSKRIILISTAVIMVGLICFVVTATGSRNKISPQMTKKSSKERTCKKDGSIMVYVPGGEFVMGGISEQQPTHVRILPGYWIDKREVTNAQFKKFIANTHYAVEGDWKIKNTKNWAKLPAIGVTWKDACAYAKWVGKRLPTEAEWERAARGTKGQLYSWGNEWNPSLAVLGKKSMGDVEPVGSHPRDKSPVGCLDMAGNAQEWCLEHYTESAYIRYIKGDNTYQRLGSIYSARGSGPCGNEKTAKCSCRFWGTPGWPWCGFRCVDGPDPKFKYRKYDYDCEYNSQPLIYDTQKPPSNPKPGDVWICPKNKAEMVYIPAGKFKTGYNNKLTTASTGSYWISRYPITVQQAREFIRATKYKPLEYWRCYDLPGQESHPACGFAYEDAEAYAKWVGQRLPTATEWEKALRGTDGRNYPWGNQNMSDWHIPYYGVPRLESVPIGTRPGNKSPYGVYDMASALPLWIYDSYLEHNRVVPGVHFTPSSDLKINFTEKSEKKAANNSVMKTYCKKMVYSSFCSQKEPYITSVYAIDAIVSRKTDGKTYPSPEGDPEYCVFRCAFTAK